MSGGIMDNWFGLDPSGGGLHSFERKMVNMDLAPLKWLGISKDPADDIMGMDPNGKGAVPFANRYGPLIAAIFTGGAAAGGYGGASAAGAEGAAGGAAGGTGLLAGSSGAGGMTAAGGTTGLTASSSALYSGAGTAGGTASSGGAGLLGYMNAANTGLSTARNAGLLGNGHQIQSPQPVVGQGGAQALSALASQNDQSIQQQMLADQQRRLQRRASLLGGNYGAA